MAYMDNKFEDLFPLKEKPEFYLGLFKREIPQHYEDLKEFISRVGITGMPFLKIEEFETARKIIPPSLREVYGSYIKPSDGRIYLRGREYYLNLQQPALLKNEAFTFLKERLERTIKHYPLIIELSQKATSIHEKMILASLMDHHKNYSLITFTGLYQSMREDRNINQNYLAILLELARQAISNYYNYIIEGKQPRFLLDEAGLEESLSQINHGRAYSRQRSLGREFDHPGRIIMYSSHLLEEMLKKGKRYHLGIDPLNGSAEIGETIRVIGRLMGKNIIDDIDYLRYSTKDEKHPDIGNLDELLTIAVPEQLRGGFKDKIRDKNIIIIDENISEGGTLYNVRKGIMEIAKNVDITVAEVNYNPENPDRIRITEKDLDYAPIGVWRDQTEIINEIRRILG